MSVFPAIIYCTSSFIQANKYDWVGNYNLFKQWTKVLVLFRIHVTVLWLILNWSSIKWTQFLLFDELFEAVHIKNNEIVKVSLIL